ncbi:hypothetical protein [Tissierella praeacuta]|uniref:hypothetical protein n=1 Tax=Tissierella praeacuta TaxID=43131 RepID=UPI003342077D
MKERIVVWLNKNSNHIFKIFFGFWFLISSYFLFPIPRALSLSRNLGVFSHVVAYYMGILLFFGAFFLSKKVSTKVSLFIFIILNIILAVLFNKVKVINFNYFGDSILRLVASFACLAFIRHARQVNHTLKMRKNNQEMNQMTIYPRDVQKKVTKGVYRYTTSDEDFWIKVQDDTATIEYLCSFCILFFVFLVPNEYLDSSTIFVIIISIFRLVKHKWVLVDKDGKVV